MLLGAFDLLVNFLIFFVNSFELSTYDFSNTSEGFRNFLYSFLSMTFVVPQKVAAASGDMRKALAVCR